MKTRPSGTPHAPHYASPVVAAENGVSGLPTMALPPEAHWTGGDDGPSSAEISAGTSVEDASIQATRFASPKAPPSGVGASKAEPMSEIVLPPSFSTSEC